MQIGKNSSGETFISLITEDSEDDQHNPDCWFLNEANAEKLFESKNEIMSIMTGTMDESKFIKVHAKNENHKHIMDQKDLSEQDVKAQMDEKKKKIKKAIDSQKTSIRKMNEDERYCHEAYRHSS